MTAPAKRLYTVAEAADELGMGRSTLYRAVKDKEVPSRLILGKTRFTEDDLKQIIADAYRPAA